MSIFRVIVLAVFLGAAPVWAQVDLGIVLPFENNTRNPDLDWISESFVEVLSSHLASPRFLMFDRRERAAAFDSLGIPAGAGILSDATIYKVAQALDANKVIRGHYDGTGGVFTVTAWVLDMDAPSLSDKFTESGPPENLLEIQAGLAWQLQRWLRPSFSISKSEYIREGPKPRLDAFEHYFRGLAASNRAEQIGHFRRAMSLDPRFTGPAFALGILYFRDRDYPTSILWLTKLQRGDPDYLEANYFLGLDYLYREQYDRAAAAFRVVEQELPLNEVYNNLGIALLRQNRPGAVPYFEKAALSDPTDPDYQLNLGYAYWKRGSCAEAVPRLRVALQRENFPAVRAVYIQCLEKTGQVEESRRQAALLEAEAPGWRSGPNPALLEKLERPKDSYHGASFRQLRMLLQIQAELKHTKLPVPEHVALHYQQAVEYLQRGADREAIEELHQVIDYNPEETEAYRDLARIYRKAQRWDEAVKALSQPLQHDPAAEDYLLLAEIFMAQGKLEDARLQLNTALRLEPESRAAAALREELNSRSAAPPSPTAPTIR
jgi:tetratricopeptide (TPR) repeat protein